MGDFERNEVKEYRYWKVLIHDNQGFLGRCIIWCKRQEVEDLAEVTKEEYDEVLEIIKDLRKALSALYLPDWFNYAFLGNEVRHLHCHVIPRYEGTRTVNGILFSDPNFGHNWKTDHSFITPDNIREQIRKQIQEIL